MYEQDKVDEARYFIEQMKLTQSDYLPTIYSLSAVLSAARSALQYALLEAQSKAGGQAWYDASVQGSSLIPYLRDKRNISIHQNPIKPHKDVTVHVQPVSVGAAVGGSSSATGAQQVQAPTTATHRYWFLDWSGPEDIIALTTAYVDEIESLVLDGQQKGYLTP